MKAIAYDVWFNLAILLDPYSMQIIKSETCNLHWNESDLAYGGYSFGLKIRDSNDLGHLTVALSNFGNINFLDHDAEWWFSDLSSFTLFFLYIFLTLCFTEHLTYHQMSMWKGVQCGAGELKLWLASEAVSWSQHWRVRIYRYVEFLFPFGFSSKGEGSWT